MKKKNFKKTKIKHKQNPVLEVPILQVHFHSILDQSNSIFRIFTLLNTLIKV